MAKAVMKTSHSRASYEEDAATSFIYAIGKSGIDLSLVYLKPRPPASRGGMLANRTWQSPTQAYIPNLSSQLKAAFNISTSPIAT